MEKYGPLWSQRELDRLLAQMKSSMESLNLAVPSILEQLRQFQTLSAEFSLPTEFLTVRDEILRAMDVYNLSSSVPSLAVVNPELIGVISSVQQQISSLAKTYEPLAANLDLVSKTLAESMIGPEALLSLSEKEFMNTSVLTNTQEAFGLFAEGKVSFAVDASEAFRTNTICAMAASASFLPNMSRATELGVLFKPELARALIEVPSINVFRELEVDLETVDLNDPDTEVVALVDGSASARVVKLGGSIVELVYQFNVEGERSGDGYVFKPTSKTMLAFHVVPTMVASEEGLFSEVVDHLYFLLYEGSGAAKRLTSRIPKEKLEALWRLKHLRLGTRHDTDHGSDSESAAKAALVGQAYNELIGRPLPRLREEWLAAQQALYKSLLDMLEEIWFGEE